MLSVFLLKVVVFGLSLDVGFGSGIGWGFFFFFLYILNKIFIRVALSSFELKC